MPPPCPVRCIRTIKTTKPEARRRSKIKRLMRSCDIICGGNTERIDHEEHGAEFKREIRGEIEPENPISF
jgi:hypothetical protein